jgi:hypothetical protein
MKADVKSAAVLVATLAIGVVLGMVGQDADASARSR